MSYMQTIAEAIYGEVCPEGEMEPEERGLYLTYAVLARTMGQTVTNENVHDAWSAWKTLTDPSHESLRPFHELADLLAHAPRGFVGDAKRSLAARRDEQIDGIEPQLQRRAAALKDRPGGRVQVIPALSARERPAVRELVERAFDAASPAGAPKPEPNFHDLIYYT